MLRRYKSSWRSQSEVRVHISDRAVALVVQSSCVVGIHQHCTEEPASAGLVCNEYGLQVTARG